MSRAYHSRPASHACSVISENFFSRLSSTIFRWSGSLAKCVTIVWPPGSGQFPDNALIRRLANALSSVEGCRIRDVVSVTYELFAATVRKLRSQGRSVVLGGHSRGAGLVARFASEQQVPDLLAVPTLTLLGELDLAAQKTLSAECRKKCCR